MLTDEVRQRLSQLNRQSLPHCAGGPTSRIARTDRVTLDDLPGGQVHESASGRHFRICRRLGLLWPRADGLGADDEPSCAAPESADVHPELIALARHFPRQALFLDLETCGFAGSMVFLVGLVRHDGGQLVLDQLLARDYSEERAMLETLWQEAAACQVLVTFNGKSFDWPMIADRSTRHRLGPGPRQRGAHLAHCDMLHHARRRWKGTLADCKLQTLERSICGRFRRGDIAGAEIPLAYHQFVRNGDARPIASILRHNALDLVTLVQLTLALTDKRCATAASPRGAVRDCG